MIGQISTSGGTGYCIEYTGTAIRALSMEERMTVCNMTIEAGARSGLIAPDEKTFEYLRGRPFAPEDFDAAVDEWKKLPSDPGADYDRVERFHAADIEPQVTWGTNPGQVTGIGGEVPDPDGFNNPTDRKAAAAALEYMGLQPKTKMVDVKLDCVFIGSCTNGRIEDLRTAAAVARGHRVAPGVQAMVVPGSQLVKRQAEAEGLDKIFTAAGFEWREAGCSMCLAMNPDKLEPGQRCTRPAIAISRDGRARAGGRIWFPPRWPPPPP